MSTNVTVDFGSGSSGFLDQADSVDVFRAFGISACVWLSMIGVLMLARVRKEHRVAHTGRVAKPRSTSLRARVAHSYGNSVLWLGLEFTNIVMSIAYLLLFFVLQQQPSVSIGVFIPDIIIASFFLVWFIWRLMLDSDRIHFLTRPSAVIDIFTTFPVYISLGFGQYSVAGFMRILRLYHFIIFMRLLPVYAETNKDSPFLKRLASYVSTGLSSQLIILVFQMLVLLVSSAALISLFETSGDFWRDKDSRPSQELPITTAVYFTFVTMSTVGYGDISPVTTLGRVTVIIFIMLSIIIIPAQLGVLVELVNTRPVVLGRKPRHGGRKPVVVTGSITCDSLKSLFNGLFSPEPFQEPPTVIILSNERPSSEMRSFLLKPQYYHRIYLIEGSPLQRTDLEKVDLDSAKCVLIVANRHTANPVAEDERNIMRLWAIKNYRPHTRVHIQVLLESSRKRLLALPEHYVTNNSIVCLEEVKLSLMAQSALYPGFATLLSNMVRKAPAPQPVGPHWKAEYNYGASFHLYAKRLTLFHYQKFLDVVKAVHYAWDGKVLLLGLVATRKVNGVKVRRVILGPGDTEETAFQFVEPKDWALVLAPTEKDANLLSIHREELLDEPLRDEFLKLGLKIPNEKAVRHYEKSLAKLRAEEVAAEKLHLRRQKKMEAVAKRLAAEMGAHGSQATEATAGSSVGRHVSASGKGKRDAPVMAREEGDDDDDKYGDDDGFGASPFMDGVSSEDVSSCEEDVQMRQLGTRDVEARLAEGGMVDTLYGMLNPQAAHLINLDRPAASFDPAQVDEELRHMVPVHDRVRQALYDSPRPDADAQPRVHSSILPAKYTPEDYVMEPKRSGSYRWPMPVLKDGAQLQNLSGHIIICGDVPNLTSFIGPLRARVVFMERKIKPIVILSKQSYQDRERKRSIRRFQEVYTYAGSPLNKEDLQAVRVKEADRIVIVARPSTLSSGDIDGNMVDSEAMFAALNVSTLCHSIRRDNIIIEVINSDNMEFMDIVSRLRDPRRLQEEEGTETCYESPFFASGRTFSSVLFDMMLAQCYSNPTIIPLFRILCGTPSVYEARLLQERGSILKEVRLQKHLVQMDMPEQFREPGQQWGYQQLFTELINRHGIIPVALWRQPTAQNGATYSYLYTNPTPTTQLHHTDRVFALVPYSLRQASMILPNELKLKPGQSTFVAIPDVVVAEPQIAHSPTTSARSESPAPSTRRGSALGESSMLHTIAGASAMSSSRNSPRPSGHASDRSRRLSMLPSSVRGSSTPTVVYPEAAAAAVEPRHASVASISPRLRRRSGTLPPPRPQPMSTSAPALHVVHLSPQNASVSSRSDMSAFAPQPSAPMRPNLIGSQPIDPDSDSPVASSEGDGSDSDGDDNSALGAARMKAVHTSVGSHTPPPRPMQPPVDALEGEDLLFEDELNLEEDDEAVDGEASPAPPPRSGQPLAVDALAGEDLDFDDEMGGDDEG